MKAQIKSILLLLLFLSTMVPAAQTVDRSEYEEFLKSHPFHPSNYYGINVRSIPKRDRPDLRWQQDYLMTMNPATRRPNPETMRTTQLELKAKNGVRISTPGTTTNPWVERGPNNVAGRTRAIAWDPNDIAKQKVYAGGVTGGLWVNNNIYDANSAWTKVSAFWDNLSITAIAFDPTNPQIVYVGTGEGWGTGSSRGFGVWKSTDAGANWTNLATTQEFFYVNDIVVRNESGNGVLYVATRGNSHEGVFHGTDQQGLQRSDDGGATFTQVMPDVPSGSGKITPADLEIDASNKLWVASQSNAFRDGGGIILSSTDGITWNTSTERPNGARVEIATAPSDANVLYALVEFENKIEEVLKSSDGGTSWANLTEPDDADDGIPADDFSRGQAWYDLIIAVNPLNADEVIAGAIDLFKSSDGGATWDQISHWYGGFGFPEVHADQHAIVYKGGAGADASDVLFGHDGGVDISTNITTASPSFERRNNNYNVTQFYSVAMHPTANTDFYIGGTQDNGSQRFNAAGMNSTQEVSGGDGGFAFIDQTLPDFQITSYVYNEYFLSTDGGTSFDQNNAFLSDENAGRFINPADYDDNLHILYSANSTTALYRVTGINGTPSVGTITLPDMGEIASHIRVSPHTTTSTTLYVGTSAGKVFKITTADATPNVTEITANLPTGWVSSIDLGVDENQILVTLSNYGIVSVFESSDGGGTWVSKEGNLPDLPVRWGMYNPDNRNEVILATELGVWRTENITVATPAWSQINNGMANVRVDMLQYRPSDKQVVAATHGRGIFTSQFDNADDPVIDPQTFTITENLNNGAIVGAVAATDPNSAALIFSIAEGNTGGTFAIVASGAEAGKLTVLDSTLLDFETTPTFLLKVNVSNGTAVVQGEITINLTNVNEMPILDDFTAEIFDNIANAAVVATATGTDVDAGTTLSYTITDGNAANVFVINSNSGVITINDNSALDFPTVSQYNLTIEVSDGTLTSTGILTVDVLKFNNPPVINNQTFSVDENVANNTLVGTVAASEADGDDFAFSILSGNDAGTFAINSTNGELTVLNNSQLDFEENPTFALEVEVRETATNPAKFATATITVNLQNINETPVFVNQAFEIFETLQNNDVAATILASDPDASTTLNFSILSGNDAGVFTLEATTGILTIADNTNLDAAITPSYTLGVRVSDGAFDVDATITVDVFEFNTAPTIDDKTFALDENSSPETIIGLMDFSDEEADGLTFSIASGNDLGAFTIDVSTSELSVADNVPLDFETNPTFTLRVVVSQTAPVLRDTATITINLNNVPEAPSISDQSFTVAELSPNGFNIGTVVASDPDGDQLRFSITAGDPNSVFFMADNGDISVIDSANLNFEVEDRFVLSVRVEKENNSALSNSATVTIDVIDQNDAPVTTGGTYEINENLPNNTLIGTLTASDEDGHDLEFSISDGNSDGIFAIDAITGALTVADSTLIDFEINQQFTLIINATETSTNPALFDTAIVIINVKNVNEPPVIEDQTYTIADNLEIGDFVARVIATDLDPNTVLTFTILGGNTGNVFQIGTSSGDLIIRDNFPLDAVATPQYLLNVQVSDGSFNRTATITIDVTKFNEAPVVNNQVVNLNENPAPNSNVYQVVATDDGDNLLFSITDGNSLNAFAISATGLITVADSSKIDFETNPRFDLKITVAETNSVERYSTTANVRINVIDKNEPTVILPQTFSIPEQSVVGYAVGRVIATDPDRLDFPTFTIKSGNTGTTFALNSINGQLTVANNTILRFATNPVFTLNVEVDDGEFKRNADITINLIKINAPPVIADQNVLVNENTAVGVAIDTLVASDIENDQLKFILQSGNRGGTFSLDPNGTLRVANNTLLDFEKDSTFTLTVVVQEALLNPGKTDTATVKVTIVNLNEAPVMADSVFTVAERAPNNTVVGTMTATDQDAGAVIRYSITAGNTGNAFAINQNTGQIRVATSAALVFATSPVFTLTVRVTDGTLNKDASAIINLVELNLPPVVTGKTLTIAENTPKGAFVDSVKATDPNKDAILFAITAGNIGNTFAISDAGVITVNSTDSLVYALYPEFNLTVTVTDKNRTPALSGTGVIKIKLNDVPVFNNQSFSVVENSAKDLEIGQLEATDAVGSALRFTIISGNPQNAVAVSSTGLITLNNPDVFDFETFRSFTLVVQATDSILTKNAIVTIFIVDDPEGPTISDQEYSILENPVPGILLGRVKAVDPDGRELVYKIISGNIDGAFFLNSAGTLTVANPGPINFEINPVINLLVQVNDETDSARATVKINVLDRNDAPEFKYQSIAIPEDTPAGTIIGNLNATDPEGDLITYKMISGNLDSAFAVSATGELSVLRAVLDYEKKTLYTLTIEVKDDTLAFQNIIEIEIINVVDNILLTGIDDEELKITVYPNPVADRLYVNIPPAVTVERIIMIDLSGKTHFTAGEVWGDQLEINMSTYQPGMYILMINDQSFKIIKK